MAGYREIVFATDLTDAAVTSGHRAVEQARCSGGRLTLLHVVEHYPEEVTGAASEQEDPEAFLAREAETRLREFADRIGAADAHRQVVLTRLSARQGILRYLLDNKPDLIILGAIGHPGALGTTVDGVAADSPCDVLIVQGGAWKPA